MTELTDSLWLKIAALHTKGYTIRQIGEELNVPFGTVGRWIRENGHTRRKKLYNHTPEHIQQAVIKARVEQRLTYSKIAEIVGISGATIYKICRRRLKCVPPAEPNKATRNEDRLQEQKPDCAMADTLAQRD